MPSLDQWGSFIANVGIPMGILFVVLWYVRMMTQKIMDMAERRESRNVERVDQLVTKLLGVSVDTTKAINVLADKIHDLEHKLDSDKKEK
jgi:peroxiredoxin